MASPRIRRLQLDYKRLHERFDGWAPIQILEESGDPPERYRIGYHVTGLAVALGGEIHERHEHLVEIRLSLEYPRRAPQCKILGNVFHPNFDANTICIGDFWAASEGLDDLIIRIGRMIAYQEYNTKSPLNGLAAKWASEHAHLLPVDAAELAPPLDRESENLDPLQITLDKSEPEVVPAPLDSDLFDKWYYLDDQSQVIGPFSAAEILAMAGESPCWIWQEGLTDWISSDESSSFLRCASRTSFPHDGS